MIVGTVEIKLYAPWVCSLKEKRMVVKSIIAKTQNKFHVAVAEVDAQDTPQTIILGIACVAGTVSQSDSILDHVLAFIENHTEAEMLDIRREVR